MPARSASHAAPPPTATPLASHPLLLEPPPEPESPLPPLLLEPPLPPPTSLDGAHQ